VNRTTVARWSREKGALGHLSDESATLNDGDEMSEMWVAWRQDVGSDPLGRENDA
jgi:hypothetical protein